MKLVDAAIIYCNVTGTCTPWPSCRRERGASLDDLARADVVLFGAPSTSAM